MNNLVLFMIMLIIAFALVVFGAVIPSSQIPVAIKLLIFIIGLMLTGLSVLMRYYSEFIFKMVKQRSKSVVLDDSVPYYMSTGKDAIILRNEDEYTATVFIKIPLYRSSTEMKDIEKIEFSNLVGRLIGQSKDIAKYTTGLFVLNKDLYIQQIRNNISEAENEESDMNSGNAPKEKIGRVRGKLSMWRNMLDTVNSSISFDQVSYITISSKGTTEFEAVSIVQQKAKEFISGTGTLFGVPPTIITGTDILKFIEPEYQLPYSTMAESISKGIKEEMI